MEASSTDLPHLRALFDIYFSFHIVGGHVLIPVLLVTFLLSKAKRDATLINLGMTLMLSSIFSCLLSVVPRVLLLPPLMRPCQGSMRMNTLDPNQIRDCVSLRLQRLAQVPLCSSLLWPIL